jgi:hypothetical protein
MNDRSVITPSPMVPTMPDTIGLKYIPVSPISRNRIKGIRSIQIV